MNKIYEGNRSEHVYLPPGYSAQDYVIKEIELEKITDQIWGSQYAIPLKETPHFKYTQGDVQPLKDYFNSCRGITWARKGTPAENMTVEELIGEFDVILKSDKDYLEPPFESHYIIVNNYASVDGTRRACTLLSNGITSAPVAWQI